MRIAGWALSVALGLAASSGWAGETPSKGAPPVTVQMTEDGPVLATAAGLTLYSWASDDSVPGKSACTNKHYREVKNVKADVYPFPDADHRRTCVDKWFPLVAGPDAAPAAPWSLITRDDGAKQWAYEGHPLYSSIKDHRAGDVNGVELARGALVMRDWRPAFAPLDLPPGLKLVREPQGLVLASADGRPLYVRRGVQTACDGCGDQLRPLRAAAVAYVHGDWSVMDAAEGQRQFVFKGEKLYLAPENAEDVNISNGWVMAVWRPTAGHPAEVSTTMSFLGEVYTTTSGMGLYVFSCQSPGADRLSCDDPGDAAAYWSAVCGTASECAQEWPLLRAPAGARQIGEWSVMDVADPLFGDPAGATYLPSQAPRTVKTWAYRGRPVHTYAEDDTPGQLLGTGREPFNAIPVQGTEVER